MRELDKVIDAIIEVIPEDQKGLILSLKDHKSSYEFAAPEFHREQWLLTGESLEDTLGPPPYEEEWKNRVFGIFMDQIKIEPKPEPPAEEFTEDMKRINGELDREQAITAEFKPMSKAFKFAMEILEDEMLERGLIELHITRKPSADVAVGEPDWDCLIKAEDGLDAHTVCGDELSRTVEDNLECLEWNRTGEHP